MAHLQTHQVGETRRTESGADAPAQVSAGHLLFAQGQNGPTQAHGQRQHHHRHGKGTVLITFDLIESTVSELSVGVCVCMYVCTD